MTMRHTGSIMLASRLHFVLNLLLFEGLVRGAPMRQRMLGCAIGDGAKRGPDGDVAGGWRNGSSSEVAAAESGTNPNEPD
jgi:hypothetical protein